jgi:hypothetical protein
VPLEQQGVYDTSLIRWALFAEGLLCRHPPKDISPRSSSRENQATGRCQGQVPRVLTASAPEGMLSTLGLHSEQVENGRKQWPPTQTPKSQHVLFTPDPT